MFDLPAIRYYPKIALEDERRLIAKAQRGSKKCANEIVSRHASFVLFRLHKKVLPSYLHRHGADLFGASLPVLYEKIRTYDLGYRDAKGRPKPVRFVSYIWKRIDGFIIDSLKQEIKREKMEEADANI